MSAKAKRTALEISVVLVAFVAINLICWLYQDPITVRGGRGFDGATYYRVAEQLVKGIPVRATGRFAYRVGTPFLASLLYPDDLILSFKVVNICGNAIAAGLFLVWLRFYLSSWLLRAGLVVLYLSHWLALTRFTHYYPVLVDSWSSVFCLAGLNLIALIERRPKRILPWLGLCVVCAVGVLFRRLIVIVPFALLFAQNPIGELRRAFPHVKVGKLPLIRFALPLALAIAGIVWLRSVVTPTDTGFSASAHLLKVAYRHSVLDYLHGWLIAFGPLLFLVIFRWRQALRHLRDHQFQLAHLAAVALISFTASYESERHSLHWAAPVVYLLIGKAIEGSGALLKSPALIAVLAASQALVHRVFWMIPDHAKNYKKVEPLPILTPVGKDVAYLHLFPHYTPNWTKAVWLAEYLLLGAVLLVWLSWRATKLAKTDQRDEAEEKRD